MSFTKCCNLKYIGENHNPVHRGVCRNCGDGLFDVFDKMDRIEEENKRLREGIDCTSRELNEVLDKCFKDENEAYYIVADRQYKLARSILKELGG